MHGNVSRDISGFEDPGVDKCIMPSMSASAGYLIHRYAQSTQLPHTATSAAAQSYTSSSTSRIASKLSRDCGLIRLESGSTKRMFSLTKYCFEISSTSLTLISSRYTNSFGFLVICVTQISLINKVNEKYLNYSGFLLLSDHHSSP